MAFSPASAPRRIGQRVYVDVPSSPYSIAPSFYHGDAAMMPRLTLRKNTPSLRPINISAPRPSDVLAAKRKTLENDLLSIKAANAKKPKIAEESVADTTQHLVNTAANACPEFPDGFIYCHHCSQKRDAAGILTSSFIIDCRLTDTHPASVHCTSVKTVKGVKKICKVKLCDQCLKRRYGENPEKIKTVGKDGVYTFMYVVP